MAQGPLWLHRETVVPTWIDHNGHMNLAYYLVAFDHAADALFDHLGIDRVYRESTGGSTFTAEVHITYQRELALGDALEVAIQVLGADRKRLHLFYQMYHGDKRFLAATCEWMALHMDLNTRKVVPMPDSLMAKVSALAKAHRDLPRPPEVGRVIGIPSS